MKKYLFPLHMIVAISGLVHWDASAASCSPPSVLCPTEMGKPSCCASSQISCRIQCGGGLPPITQKCPAECPEALKWTDVADQNYQVRCDTITETCEYRCKANYMKMLPIGTQKLNCIPCPAPGISNAGSTCYVPTGTSTSDTSGDVTYTADCDYSRYL